MSNHNCFYSNVSLWLGINCVIIADLDFSFIEMNPFTLVNGEPYPLDMRGELDDTAAFKNFNKYVIVLTLP